MAQVGDLDFDRVLDWLWVGTSPQSPADVRALVDLGVQAVLNVQSDEDLADRGPAWKAVQTEYMARRIVLRRVRVDDFDPDDLARHLPECVDELRDLRGAGYRVYLHCTAGINRSPTVAIAYLHRHEGLSVDEARDLVQARRPCAPYPRVLASLSRIVRDCRIA